MDERVFFSMDKKPLPTRSMDKDRVPGILASINSLRTETIFSGRWRKASFFWLLVTAKKPAKLRRHDTVSLRWSP